MKLFKRFFLKRLPEVDLNCESAKAAAYYVEQRQKDAPTVEKTNMLNYVATGFYMGYRFYEEQLGIKGDKNAN